MCWFQILRFDVVLVETEEKDNWNLVFEAKMEVRQHVQTWRQQNHFIGNDAQFPFLRLPWIPTDTNDVTTAQFVVDCHKLLL